MIVDSVARRMPVTKNLLLLDIKPTFFSDDFAKCRDMHGMLYLKGCRRTVLVGDAEIKGQIDINSEGVSVYETEAAYRHLLTYVTGLISRTRGESQIVAQFKAAYLELGERSPASADAMNRLYGSIIYDNGLVRNNVTSSLKPAFYEACAYELSDQQRNDAVVVVANTNKGGKPDAITDNIVKYLGSNRKNKAYTIIFTHPDPKILNNIHTHFLKQKVNGKIVANISTLPFNEVFDANDRLQRVDRVYVCFPMDGDLDANKRMLEEWRQKEVLGGKLVHLGGGKKESRVSTGVWFNSELFNYVSPEGIVKWQISRKSRNEEIIQKGMKACGICADSRSKNYRPSKSALLNLMVP